MADAGEDLRDIIHPGDVEMLSVSSGTLVALAKAGATGELVCSCGDRDARVYLQRGRVAWANDCMHRHAFTGHLKQHARLGTPAIEAVVIECRNTRRPIGETLVERRLATAEQVRAALRHQIGLALHNGECGGAGRSVFLPRNYDEYDVRFTFEASELVAEEGAGAPVSHPEGRPTAPRSAPARCGKSP
jgi:hypothetical protein